MSKTNFYLKDNDPKKTTASLIYLSFSHNGKRIRKSTGEKVIPKDWSQKDQRVKKSCREYDSINDKLQKLAEDYRKSERTLKSVGAKITRDTLEKQIDIHNNVVNKGNKTLFGFIEHFINTRTGVAHGTIKSYKTTLNVLHRFKLHRNKGIDFDSIDMNFYDDFNGYLCKKLKYSGNTVGKHIKNLKVFMNEAGERGLHTNYDYLKKGFKVFKEDIDNIYLTEDELKSIYELDLSKDQRLEHARDLFIVGCYTGLRFSDFSQIKKENIQNQMISLRTQKTGELIAVPVHPMIEEIMTKYKGKFSNSLPPAYANQVMNGYLKKLGELAGFDQTVLITKTIGGKKVQLEFKKYEIITTHTARRSFATNLIMNGFPAINIMKITGHRSEKNFMNYVKVSPQQNAEKLRQFWEKQKQELKLNNERKSAKLEIVA